MNPHGTVTTEASPPAVRISSGGMKMLIAAFGAIALLPLLNFSVLAWNSLTLDMRAYAEPVVLGQMGDFFGGHTAAFSGLLSVALVLYFQRAQLEATQRSSDLQSILTIYQHYGQTCGVGRDFEDILKSVAEGHRRWSIRESFSLIDARSALEKHRQNQVKAEFQDLVQRCARIDLDVESYRNIARNAGSLLLDKRLDSAKRQAIWQLYELLREAPVQLLAQSGTLHERFRAERLRFAAEHAH
ncbi:hypothetical protein [Ramlibacter algicola]|uniref:Uncharacterized protein n=1 Tax=Ramlibacter algicola TaxID=2795217 RepID=A0A934Q407_9BURK|nr:hypothetical protein [Ramlibacter algicola]MBK0393807.1 hypothetical protein [Ramlibacter algicola]